MSYAYSYTVLFPPRASSAHTDSTFHVYVPLLIPIRTGNVPSLCGRCRCGDGHGKQAVEAILATEIGRKCASVEDTKGRVPAHLAAMSSRRDLVELLLPHSGLGAEVELEEIMARGKVGTALPYEGNFI